MTYIIRLTIIIIIALLLFLIITHNNERTRVYMIHSYNTDLSWVREIDTSFNRVMTQSAVDVRHHYMDLRNHPSCNFYRTRAKDVELAIQSWKPDVIVLVDDLAQQLVGINYLNTADVIDASLYDNIAEQLARQCPDIEKNDADYFGLASKVTDSWHPKIVFAGVNGSVDPYGYNKADNIKGIFENKNYNAIVETLKELKTASKYQQMVPKVVVINENSATTRAERDAFFTQETFDPFKLEKVFLVSTLEEWKKAVRYANDNNALILTANYNNIKNGDKKEPVKDLIRWTVDTADAPVLGAGTDFVKDGGMITLAIAGSEQGRVAADLVNEWIKTIANGETVGSENYRRAKQYIIGLDYRLAKVKNVQLPLIYEAFSRETNNFSDEPAGGKANDFRRVVGVNYTTINE